MATQLSVWNDALLLLGERKLASITETQSIRYDLESAWDNGLVESILEDKGWNWAKTVVQIDYDPSITPEFGYQYAFTKPTDMLKISGVWSDAYRRCPLTLYDDDAANFYAGVTTIYLEYIPEGKVTAYSEWPVYFARYVAAATAKELVPKLKNNAEENKVIYVWRQRKMDAESKDAQSGPPKIIPEGNWVRSARGRGNSTSRYIVGSN